MNRLLFASVWSAIFALSLGGTVHAAINTLIINQHVGSVITMHRQSDMRCGDAWSVYMAVIFDINHHVSSSEIYEALQQFKVKLVFPGYLWNGVYQLPQDQYKWSEIDGELQGAIDDAIDVPSMPPMQLSRDDVRDSIYPRTGTDPYIKSEWHQIRSAKYFKLQIHPEKSLAGPQDAFRLHLDHEQLTSEKYVLHQQIQLNANLPAYHYIRSAPVWNGKVIMSCVMCSHVKFDKCVGTASPKTLDMRTDLDIPNLHAVIAHPSLISKSQYILSFDNQILVRGWPSGKKEVPLNWMSYVPVTVTAHNPGQLACYIYTSDLNAYVEELLELIVKDKLALTIPTVETFGAERTRGGTSEELYTLLSYICREGYDKNMHSIIRPLF